jgi:hypothetical protein
MVDPYFRFHGKIVEGKVFPESFRAVSSVNGKSGDFFEL